MVDKKAEELKAVIDSWNDVLRMSTVRVELPRNALLVKHSKCSFCRVPNELCKLLGKRYVVEYESTSLLQSGQMNSESRVE